MQHVLILIVLIVMNNSALSSEYITSISGQEILDDCPKSYGGNNENPKLGGICKAFLSGYYHGFRSEKARVYEGIDVCIENIHQFDYIKSYTRHLKTRRALDLPAGLLLGPALLEDYGCMRTLNK